MVESTAVLVGAHDRQPEELLRECGLTVRNVPPTDLVTVASASTLQAAVVVIDLRAEPRVPPGAAVLRRQHPHVGVLLIVPTMDPTVILEAMRAGVNECVAEPLTRTEFESALARLLAHQQASVARGQLFAFIGAKGGVGTTTMAVNVATALADETDQKTLIIDLHLSYGDAAVFLGAEPRFSVVDALENTHRLDLAFFKGLLMETKAGPDLLASSDRSMSGGAETKRVKTLLDFVASQYRFTVVDVPRSDPAALEALDAVTQIVVVANQEVATIRSAARMAGALRHRYGRDRVQVAVTRYDQQSEIKPEDIERVIGGKVKHTVPSDYRTALQALNKGRPLALDNHNKLSGAFHGMARTMAGLPAEKPVEVRSGGLLGGLLGRR